MSRLIPHPVLSAALVVLWMVLTRFSLGHLLLGSVIALLAGRALAALHPERPTLRGWRLIPRFIGVLALDILKSNIEMARILIRGAHRSGRDSAFVEIPLKLRSESGLAVLSIVVSATPGTAWIDYDTETGVLTLHVFDLAEVEHSVAMIRKVYEPMLQEIFE